MSLRPQDIVVSVELAILSPQTRPTYPELATALEMSLSEVHGAVKRATAAGLVDSNRRAKRVALLDFLVQGLKSAFVPKRGPLTRGMPTAHGAPPLDQLVGLGAEPPPVWPDPDGTVRGESFEPLYRSVPKAAKKDPKLYEALCLIDALRGGRPRDRALAEEHLRKLLAPASTIESSLSAKFSPNAPGRRRIGEALARTIGPGTAEFYRSAIELLAAEHPVPATSHLVAHLATEIESSVRNLILDVMAAAPVVTKGGSKTQRETPVDGDHANSIRSVLAWLEIPIEGPVGKDWLGLTGKGNEEAFSERRHRKALEPPRPIDWTFWARFEGILATVLEAFEKKYVTVFERLDQLTCKAAPSEEDAKKLRGRLPQNQIAQGYLFGRLSEPSWIEPLEKVGFFARPPDPIRRPSGVEYPGWPALEYLARMAATRPDDVARIALAVPRTENIDVTATLARIARSLPAKLAEPFAERVDEWLDMDPSHSMAYALEDSVVGLFEKLASEGCEPAALRVLAALLRPIPSPEDEDHGSSRRDPEARLAYWDLDRTMARLLPTIQKLGEPALVVLAELLGRTLAMIHQNGSDAWEDYSWNWRKVIEEHGENHNGDLRAHLVSAIRDCAIRLVESNPARLADLVASLEKRRWVFFRRLALFLLQRFQIVASDLAISRILDRSYFDLSGPEYSGLLRICFKSLSAEQQGTILSWIDDGPNLPDLPDAYTDQWRMGHLAVIAESLSEARRRQYEALRAKYGDVPAADAALPSHQLFVRPTSPFRDEQLAEMSPTQVVETIASWKPSSEFGSREPEELSRTLERVVGQSPESYAAAAGDLKRLPPVFLPGAIRGFSIALRAGRAFDWGPVLDLCVWATFHPRKTSNPKGPPLDDDAHWGNARFAVLWLLSDAMNSDSVPIPIDAHKLVWAAIAPTLDDPNGAEAEVESGDTMFLADHRVRAVAVLAAIDYARWLARKNASKGLPAEVRHALDVKVRERSSSVRAALVDRMSALAYLDEAWCESYARQLFRPDQQGRDIAWETYLRHERFLTLDVFRVMRWRYLIAIGELRSDVVLDKRGQKLAEAIGNHLARLYWHGQIAFGDRDKLLDKFLSNAPASVTGRFMEDIGHWLHTDGQPSPEVLVRLKALWVKRFAIGRPEELAVFSWWFSSGCFEETWSIDNFLAALQALDVLATGFPPGFAPQLGERLVELASPDLAKVVSCLDFLVKANEGGWAILSLRTSARTILAAALTSGDDKTTKDAKATISRLARKGYTEFRDLI
jgi:hypothetical protein